MKLTQMVIDKLSGKDVDFLDEDETQPQEKRKFCMHCMIKQWFTLIGKTWYCEECGHEFERPI